jgi:lipoprotein-releasing system ATP-binding protein
MSSLVVSHLHKAFDVPGRGRLEVLRGVSFEVTEGETLAVMGASGAGKSTLLHIIGGLEAADEGQVVLADFNLTRMRGSELARFRNAHIGFAFQFHHLLPDLTALENVQMPMLINRTARGESKGLAALALERVGLGGREGQLVGRLSGGEQQRVAIARALIQEPRLVLADEPTGNLDESHADEIGASLVSFSRAHRAVVIIATHNERLAHLCDRVLTLRDGQISSS